MSHVGRAGLCGVAVPTVSSYAVAGAGDALLVSALLFNLGGWYWQWRRWRR